MVNYSPLCRDIPPVSLYRSLERKSKHTHTHINTAWQPHSNLLPLFISVTAVEERRSVGGGLGIGECREMGQEVERERDLENSRGEREVEKEEWAGVLVKRKQNMRTVETDEERQRQTREERSL